MNNGIQWFLIETLRCERAVSRLVYRKTTEEFVDIESYAEVPVEKLFMFLRRTLKLIKLLDNS